MEKTSKELLQFEHKTPTSSRDSALLVCGKNKSSTEQKQPNPAGIPFPSPLPSSSQVLGKVRDFLGVISEANKKLELEAKDKPEEYNIEALNGNETEFIEMDLMLGVADLHTPEAVSAAEAAIAGNQPALDVYASDDSSVTSSDDEDEDDSDEDELVQPVKQQPESKKKRKLANIVELS